MQPTNEIFSDSDDELADKADREGRVDRVETPIQELREVASIPKDEITCRSEAKQEKNRLISALMAAAQSYSLQSRTLSFPRSKMRWEEAARVEDVIEDDEEESTEEFSDSDDECCGYGGPNTLDSGDASKLFYKPVGEWASLLNEPIENSRIIMTLHEGAMCEAFIKQGAIAGREITYISKTWILDQPWNGFFSEMALYSDPNYLQPLQGKVIPTILGVYLIERRISIAMELPHSSFWVEASEDMSDSLKRKCIAAYEAIHDRGVLHGDAELRHMLINAEGDATIIDFQCSQALKPIEEVGLTACTPEDIRIEKRKVRYKLDYQDAQWKENMKRKRVYEKEARNVQRRIKRRRVQPGSESESDDPEEIADPIVPLGCWTDEWLQPGLDFEPTCFIVPGQDRDAVLKASNKFAANEILTRKTESSSTTSTTSSSSLSSMQIQGSSSNSALLGLPKIVTPRKRIRAVIEPSPVKGRPRKRRAVTAPLADNDINPFPVPVPANFCETEPIDFESLIGIDISRIVVPPSSREPLYIPYEGFDGRGGAIIPNEFVNDGVGKVLGDRRRQWIAQANIARCTHLGYRHPQETTARESPSPIRLPGNKHSTSVPRRAAASRKSSRRRLTVALGQMKRDKEDAKDCMRALEQMESKRSKYYWRQTLEPSALDDLEDSDDEHPELPAGPAILPWSEHYAEEEGTGREKPLISVPESPAFVEAALSVPLRSALRRPLSLEEKLRQRAYEQTLAALQPQVVTEPDDEDSEAMRSKPSPTVPPKMLTIRRQISFVRPPSALESPYLCTTSTTSSPTTRDKSSPSAPSISNAITISGRILRSRPTAADKEQDPVEASESGQAQAHATQPLSLQDRLQAHIAVGSCVPLRAAPQASANQIGLINNADASSSKLLTKLPVVSKPPTSRAARGEMRRLLIQGRRRDRWITAAASCRALRPGAQGMESTPSSGSQCSSTTVVGVVETAASPREESQATTLNSPTNVIDVDALPSALESTVSGCDIGLTTRSSALIGSLRRCL